MSELTLNPCAICGQVFTSLIDRDIHSFEAHGTMPGSTVNPWCAHCGRITLPGEVHTKGRCVSIDNAKEPPQ